MTVYELLQVPTLSGFKVISGELGLHRKISTVTVIDTPDGFNWLNGNEVVITTTYASRDSDASFCEFVQKLISRNASALFVKTGRYLKEIPPKAIDLSNAYDFPLIFCPGKYSFAEIITPALSSIIATQAAELKEASLIHEKFTTLAINDNRIPEILHVLSSLIHRPTAYVDTVFKNIYFSESEHPALSALRKLPYSEILSKIAETDAFEQFAVKNKKRRFGYILILREQSETPGNEWAINIYKTAVENAAVVIILRMQVLISTHLIEEKYHSSFVEDLMLHNVKTKEEIHTRSQLYGWDLNGGGCAVIIDINNIKKHYLQKLDPATNDKLQSYTELIFDTSISYMTRSFPYAKYYQQSDFISFLLPGREDVSVKTALERVFSELRASLAGIVPFTVSMAVGSYVDDVIDIHRSFEQAKNVIQIIYQLQRFDCILFYEQLGIFKLLISVSDQKESIEFCRKYIAPLREYDSRHNSTLIETLQALVNSGWNVKAASETLFIHYNSAKYRFQKICEILDLDLHDATLHTEIELALKIYMIRNSNI